MMGSRVRSERKTAQAASPAVSRQEIAQAAYELFERRGCVPGHDVEDWLAAERIVRVRRRGRAS
jgi:hypothetical protein